MDHTEAKKPTKFFGLSRNVISMGAVSFLNDAASDMVFPFIPVFLTSVLGASATFVGLVEGVANSVANILKAVSGRISDVVHRRKPFVLFGYTLSAIAKPMLSLATAPWHVLVIRVMDRIGKGTRDAPRDALVSLSTEPHNVARAFGFQRGSDTIGAAVGPLIAFAILPLIENDLRTLFFLSFVASFIAVLIVQFFIRDVRTRPSDAEAFGEYAAFPKVEVRESIQWRELGIPFFIFVAAATIFALGRASEAFLLLRAQEGGVALSLVPIIYFVYNTVFGLISLPVGMIADRVGRRHTFMAGMLVFAVSYILFATATSTVVMWGLFIVYGIYSALTEGVGRAIVADLVPEKLRGTAFGIYNALTGVALLPASVIFGFLWDTFGYGIAFWYGAAMAITAFFIYGIFRIIDIRYFSRRAARS